MWSVQMACAGRLFCLCVLAQQFTSWRAAAKLGPAGHPTAFGFGLVCPDLDWYGAISCTRCCCLQAIEFVQMQRDDELWELLISLALGNASLTGGAAPNSAAEQLCWGLCDHRQRDD